MADNIALSAGTADGAVLATDDVGGVHYQIVKLTYGALDAATLVSVSNGLPVAQQGTWNIGTVSTVSAVTAISNALPAGTNNIGDVDVLTVPADPFGANADAASATGSISAKLRFIASTGIPITGTVAVTQSGAWSLSANQSVNVAQMNGVAVTMGNGVAGTGVQRVAIASDNTAFTVNAAQSGTWTVQPGNTANTTPWLTTDTPATSGGLSFSAVASSAASNNKTQAKSSAGQLYAICATNISASARYLKIFNNTSAGVTMGTTACDFQFVIPGATTGSGFVLNIDKGIAMGTGITYAITGAIGTTDNTSIGAGEVSVLIGYK